MAPQHPGPADSSQKVKAEDGTCSKVVKTSQCKVRGCSPRVGNR